MTPRRVFMACFAAVFVTGAAAQSPPQRPTNSAPAADVLVVSEAPPELPVPDAAKRDVAELQDVARGYARAMGVLQKEIDGVSGELNRTVARLRQQAPDGYELDTQRFVYVRKDLPKK